MGVLMGDTCVNCGAHIEPNREYLCPACSAAAASAAASVARIPGKDYAVFADVADARQGALDRRRAELGLP